MLSKYIHAAMHLAHYEFLDDGTFFGTIPNFEGLWANAETLEACRDELQSVLEGWILVGLYHRDRLPVVDNIDLTVSEVAA